MTFLRISDVIEDRHTTSLLACLYLRGRLCKTELARAVSTNPRMGQKIDRLVDLGFLSSETVGRRTELELTSIGCLVAESLCRMEEDVYGGFGDPGHMYGGSVYPFSENNDSVDDWFVTSRESRRLKEDEGQGGTGAPPCEPQS